MLELLDRIVSRKDIDTARQLVSLIPEGGLGFHGTTTFFQDSIATYGLDRSKFCRTGGKICYNGFDLVNTPTNFRHYKKDPLPQGLFEMVYYCTTIAISRTRDSDHGAKYSEWNPLPFLVVFLDPERKFPVSFNTVERRTIHVPVEDIIGTYTVKLNEFNRNDNMGGYNYVSFRFINRVFKDLVQKLNPNT